MAQSLGDIVNVVRDQLQDVREPYRHSDDKLVRYINNGLAEARRLRPDLFMPDIFGTTYSYTSSDFAASFPLTYGYEMALIEYVVGYVSAEEDEYVADSRAAAMLGRYTQKLLGAA